ncbi:programmed cell death 1 ligand 1 [Sinocyclocheilus anshuiensis]|uniref:programmed cell death 1 ligand 1 n=1 Tax=Sinocyclocheilus anshuiensis TaxID=1608454 RepID=UPI0007B7992D|nr:PREDICTED: programmed cell death 1 ligand 1-like [Sinocyclocheilus anshuiensis]
MCDCHQGSMRGMLVVVFQALLWPVVSASALFTVGLQESAYEAELHGDVRLVCLFSKVKSLSDLTVIWSRVEPKPAVDVYRLERGTENHNYTSAAFIKRAQLIHEQLSENRAVLHLKKLWIKDSGMYRCIVKEGDDGDYKQVTLNVTAPYTPVKKSLMKTGQDEAELSCESQGFPSAQVIWSNGQNTNLTEMSNSTTRSTDEDLIHIISKLTVKRDLVNNYTCSFLVKGEIRQTATFSIPDDILPHCCTQYVWIVAVVVVLLAIVFIAVILHRRRNGQKNRRNESSKCAFLFPHSSSATTDSLLTVTENTPQTCDINSEETAEKPLSLRSVLIRQYSELDTNAEMKSRLASYALLSKEGRSLNISSILPDKKEIILLLGEPGCGKTSMAQILSSCWAERTTTDPFNIRRLHLVFQVDCTRAKGDFFQVIKSSVSYEKPLDVSELRETLLGLTDCLLILDGYQEGNKDLDETLEWFLTERQTCRVLVTSHPGKCPALEKNVRTVLQLIQKPVKSGS